MPLLTWYQSRAKQILASIKCDRFIVLVITQCMPEEEVFPLSLLITHFVIVNPFITFRSPLFEIRYAHQNPKSQYHVWWAFLLLLHYFPKDLVCLWSCIIEPCSYYGGLLIVACTVSRFFDIIIFKRNMMTKVRSFGGRLAKSLSRRSHIQPGHPTGSLTDWVSVG